MVRAQHGTTLRGGSLDSRQLNCLRDLRSGAEAKESLFVAPWALSRARQLAINPDYAQVLQQGALCGWLRQSELQCRAMADAEIPKFRLPKEGEPIPIPKECTSPFSGNQPSS